MFKKLLAKVLLAFLALYTTFLTIKAPAVHAQEWYNQAFQDFYMKVFDADTSPASEIFGERYTAAQVQWVIWSLMSLPVNFILGPDLAACLFTVDWTGIPVGAVFCTDEVIARLTYVNAKQEYYANKLLKDSQLSGDSSFLASYFTSNPMSGVGYIMTRLKNLHLIPEASAQGFGFTALTNPVQGLWKASRDITYALFVLAIIVIAFMIMFRTKISPQTVITVQSALPKIVIGLILVTFSYAIAGFMIDLVYVVIGLLAALLIQSGIIIEGALSTGSLWGDVFRYLTQGPGIAGGTGSIGLLLQYLGYVGFAGFMIFLRLAFSANIAAWLTGGLGLVLWVIVWLLLLIWGFVLAFKILFMLLKTYISIIIAIIFAPFQIMLGTMIQGAGFGSWIRSLIANLAVYPIVGFMYILALIFLFAALGEGWATIINLLPTGLNFNPAFYPTGSGWSPPLTTGAADFLPLLWLGASLAVMSLIPKTTDIIKGFVTGRPLAYGTAIGESLMMAPGAIWSAGPVREYREQASALGAYRLADRAIPQSWRKYTGVGTERVPANVWAKFIERLEKRGGFGT